MIAIESKIIDRIERKRGKREDEIKHAEWRGFLRGYAYAKREHTLSKTAEAAGLIEEFQFGAHAKAELGAEIEQLDFKKGDKYLKQYIAGKSTFSEMDTLTESPKRREENVDLPLLNARVECIGDNLACCLVNFRGFPMKVSFPKSVLETHGLRENDIFLWRPAIGKEVSSSDCIPLRTNGSFSKNDIEYILEAKSYESRAKTQ